MKIKCVKCDLKYNLEKYQQCPECGGRGGFMQEPSHIILDGVKYHLEETLEHIDSKNQFQIKEVQKNGFVSRLTRGPLPKEMGDKKFYISFSNIHEYERI